MKVQIKGKIKDFIVEKRFVYNSNEMSFLIKYIFDEDIKAKNIRNHYYDHRLDFKRRYKTRGHSANRVDYQEYKRGNMIFVKTKDGGLTTKARYMYEKQTGKKLTKDQMIYFLDGDNTNFSIKNMKVITPQEHIFINTNDLKINDEDCFNIVCKLAYISKKANEQNKKDDEERIARLEKEGIEKYRKMQEQKKLESKERKRIKALEYSRNNREKARENQKKYYYKYLEKYRQWKKEYKRKKVQELKEQGVINPWSVFVNKAKPKYKEEK